VFYASAVHRGATLNPAADHASMPPLLTIMPHAVPPLATTSMPPLLTVVPLAVPRRPGFCAAAVDQGAVRRAEHHVSPPLSIVPLAVPPDSTSSVPHSEPRCHYQGNQSDA